MAAVSVQENIGKVFYDYDTMGRTIKLQTDRTPNTAEVIMALSSCHVHETEIVGICKGPPAEPGIYVTFKEKQKADDVEASSPFTYKNRKFHVVALDKQILHVKVHWLPLFFRDTLLKSIFATYGKVLDIFKDKEPCGITHIQNGNRTVVLEVDHYQKSEIPHIIKFQCGQSVLVTFGGRPPMCLRCSEIGHFRRECLAQDSYASRLRNFGQNQYIPRPGFSLQGNSQQDRAKDKGPGIPKNQASGTPPETSLWDPPETSLWNPPEPSLWNPQEPSPWYPQDGPVT